MAKKCLPPGIHSQALWSATTLKKFGFSLIIFKTHMKFYLLFG